MSTVRWWQVDPTRLLIEHAELQARYPPFSVGLHAAGLVVFQGRLTAIVADVAAVRLPVAIQCPAGFPAIAPKVIDADRHIPADRRGSHHWHVNYDGSICFAVRQCWSPQFVVADVVDKVGDWLVNTIALETGLADKMPSMGRVDLSDVKVVCE